MPPRLTELYKAGDLVEVRFDDLESAKWRMARVLGPQTPGLWVQTADGRHWFVTNGRRIRPAGTELTGDAC